MASPAPSTIDVCARREREGNVTLMHLEVGVRQPKYLWECCTETSRMLD